MIPPHFRRGQSRRAGTRRTRPSIVQGDLANKGVINDVDFCYMRLRKDVPSTR
jgi:hypothetical protein